MEKKTNKDNVWKYGYQPGKESKGYQPTEQNNNSAVSKPPKGGNVAQKD